MTLLALCLHGGGPDLGAAPDSTARTAFVQQHATGNHRAGNAEGHQGGVFDGMERDLMLHPTHS